MRNETVRRHITGILYLLDLSTSNPRPNQATMMPATAKLTKRSSRGWSRARPTCFAPATASARRRPRFFAVDNTCTHRGGPLAEGEVSGHEVTCPYHGATFDVRTGAVLGPPAERAVACYGVRVTGTDIEVEV